MSQSKHRQAINFQQKKLIAWNGIQLYVPASWDLRVSGHHHLVFEKDFHPQLQLRWQKSSYPTSRNLQKKLAKFGDQLGSMIPDKNLPLSWQRLKGDSRLITGYRGESSMPTGGVSACGNCNTMVLFQLLTKNPGLVQETADCLETLSCHDHQENLWRLQDFSLLTPVSYTLKDYTFGAGLTRLSFHDQHIFLHACRLAPASTRLATHSLEEILYTLTDTMDLVTETGDDNTSCLAHRSPSIPKQILFRLRREKPFLRSKIWHDTVNNRLLVVVLSSNRPIPQTTADTFCRNYEIIQEKT